MDVLLSEPVQALVLINVLLTLSLMFPFVTGIWSLGLPGFMCLGAYASAYVSVEIGLPVAHALVAGTVGGALVSLPFGLLALRVRGIYLAIATLAAAELVVLFFSHFEPLGGVVGYAGMPYMAVAPMAAIVGAVVALSGLLYRSRLGKAMIAAGSDPIVAACNGLHVPLLQLTALVIGGALAGLAGGLYAHYYTFISPITFSFARTVTILLFLVAGGLTPLGAVAGATLLTLLPQYITALESWAPAIYGAIVLVIMALLPDGVFPKNRLTQLRNLLLLPRADADAEPQPDKAPADAAMAAGAGRRKSGAP